MSEYTFNTVGGYSILGNGDIPLKTIDGKPITGEGNINIPILPRFATINGQPITDGGNFTLSEAAVTVDDATVSSSSVWSSQKTNQMVGRKQDTLVSGANLKTLSGYSILGPGDIQLKTVDGISLIGPGNIALPVVAEGGGGGGGSSIDDTVTAPGSTWSSTKISDSITTAENNAVSTVRGGVSSSYDTLSKLAVAVNGKQNTLVSGATIKTVGGNNIMGSGDIPFPASGAQINDGTTTSLVATWSANKISTTVAQAMVDTKNEVLGGVGPAYDTLQELTLQLTENANAVDGLVAMIGAKQDTLVSGTNIKTVADQSILGTGNLPLKTVGGTSLVGVGNIPTVVINDAAGNGNTTEAWSANKITYELTLKQPTLVSGTNVKTVAGVSILGTGNIAAAIINDAATTSTSETYSANKINTLVNAKQATLVSGTNIKTVGGTSLLGSGDIVLPTSGVTINDAAGNGDTTVTWSASKIFNQLAGKQATLVSGTSIKTVGGVSLLGSGNVAAAVINDASTTSTSDTWSVSKIATELATKQINLVSGTNIKTVGGVSLLGSGNISAAVINDAATTSTTEVWSANKSTTELATKQASLVSGTNIKTVGGTSILGSGNIAVATINDTATTSTTEVWSANKSTTELATKQASLVSGTNIKTVGGATILGSGNIAVAVINDAAASSSTTDVYSANKVTTLIAAKQDTLVSGTNIKTVNGATILGTGNVVTGDVTLTGAQTLTNKTISGGVFTDGYTEEVATANTGTAYTIDLANGTIQVLTLTGNCTYTFPTPVAGKSFLLLQKQDATGSRTVTWPATVKWPAGTSPTITSTAAKMDKLAFVSDGTSWYGTNAGLNY